MSTDPFGPVWAETERSPEDTLTVKIDPMLGFLTQLHTKGVISDHQFLDWSILSTPKQKKDWFAEHHVVFHEHLFTCTLSLAFIDWLLEHNWVSKEEHGILLLNKTNL